MRWVLVLSLFVCAAMPVWAVNPSYRISQYGHTAWRIQDGLFGGIPTAIAQTADGYLWIATRGAGALRRSSLCSMDSTSRKAANVPLVLSLLAARDGSLWIGTLPGLSLSHWKGQDLINYSSYTNAGIRSIIEDDEGTIWVTRNRITDDTGPLVIRKIAKNTVELCLAYTWPGNIRELQNIVERSVILCCGETFSIDEAWLSSHGARGTEGSAFLTESLEAHEKKIIEAALAKCKGRVNGPLGAAARLGIPPSTLDSKIKHLGIKKNNFVPAC